MVLIMLIPVISLALGARFKHINNAIKTKDRSLLYGELFMLAIIILVVTAIAYLTIRNNNN